MELILHIFEALFVAARFGKSSLISRLVERYKVDVSQRDQMGRVIHAHVAVMYRQPHALETLKRRGVPSLKNKAA